MVKTPLPEFEPAILWMSALAWVAGHARQILEAALVGALIVALLYGLKLVGKRLSRAPSPWRSVIGRALASMTLWFMIPLAAELVATFAHAPEDLANTIDFLFVIAATFQAALFLRELIMGAIEVRAGNPEAHEGLANALGLIRLLVNVVFFILAVVLILGNLGVNVTGLVAGLGIGGIAIGLAAQGIFSDLFAALTILLDKPFRRGDVIRWEGTSGTVEAIGLKSTRLRALTGEEMIVSNANLLSKELHNFARLESRRITQSLSLVYQTPADVCAGLPEDLREVVDGVEGCRFVRCGLDAFAASSLDFQLVYDIEAADQDSMLLGKHRANIAVLDYFARKGIAFAYPTQTTFTAAPDGAMVMPYATPSTPA